MKDSNSLVESPVASNGKAIRAAATALLAKGFWPVPIYPPGIERPSGVTTGKEPMGAGWGLDRLTVDTINVRLNRHKDARIGICLGPDRGPGGAWIADLEGDGDQAGESLALLLGGELAETMSWSSARGMHHVFAVDGERLLELLTQAGATEGNGSASGVFKLEALPGLEIRIGGHKEDGTPKQLQSLVPPSPGTDGLPRVWIHGPESVTTLPESAYAFLEGLAERRAIQSGGEPLNGSAVPKNFPTPPGTSAEERARKYARTIDPAISGQGGHDKTFYAACKLGPGFNLPRDLALRIIAEEFNPRCQPPWKPHEIEHKVDDAYAKESRRGWLLNAQPAMNGNPGRPRKPRAGDSIPFVNFTEKGYAKSTILNVEIWLQHNGYVIRRNDFSGVVTINGEPADDSTHTQITSLMLASVPETSWTPQHVIAAITNLAYRNRFSPPRDWLDSLSWDFTERIKNLFPCGFGSPGRSYEQESGRIFMIQGGCRVLSPGCKADYVPVLTGDQGNYKSTGLMALVPKPEWFSDTLPRDLHDHKVTGELLQGRLIIEMGELASLNRSTVEATKSFITRQEDRYRETWGRVTRDHPRMCVLAGTTNEDEFLQDTANRRFLPIATTPAPSGLKWIQDNRDQLWAEAAYIARGWIEAGTMALEMAKLGAAIEALAKDPQECARVRDPWENIFADRFIKGDKTTVAECFEILAGDPRNPAKPIDMRRGVEMRISKALKVAGFHKKRDNLPPRGWYYEKVR